MLSNIFRHPSAASICSSWCVVGLVRSTSNKPADGSQMLAADGGDRGWRCSFPLWQQVAAAVTVTRVNMSHRALVLRFCFFSFPDESEKMKDLKMIQELLP